MCGRLPPSACSTPRHTHTHALNATCVCVSKDSAAHTCLPDAHDSLNTQAAPAVELGLVVPAKKKNKNKYKNKNKKTKSKAGSNNKTDDAQAGKAVKKPSKKTPTSKKATKKSNKQKGLISI